VYNKRTKVVEETVTLTIFLKDQPNCCSSEKSESGKNNEVSQEYILLPIHPHRTKAPIEAVVQDAHEKPSENATNDKDVQNSEDDVEAMQEELLQFKLQKVWVLVDLPYGKKVIGTKWVFRNKKDERSIVVEDKQGSVAQGFRQEEGIDYDEVFAPVAKIEAIRLFLAFASYMGFTVYQMDVKSAFLHGTIGEEVYVHQPPGFIDPTHPNKVYKVIKALYGLHQAPRAWYETLSSFLMENGFRRGTIDKTLFIKKTKKYIMLVQVYVDDIIFGSTKKSMCTEFEECMHTRFQMSSMGELTFFLGLQVKHNLMEFLSVKTNSDYGGATLDRKSTTDGCQFLGRRLISWQCKKQTIVANSTTEAEYVTAAHCCGQVLWIQNQMMDYGFKFINTKIHIDNESTISVIKNPVAHSRTKHIEIRFHFIRDCYEKRLIEVIKIHTDHNVADLLTKRFDITRLYSLYKIFYQQKDIDQNDVVEGVHWILSSYLVEGRLGNAEFHEIIDFLTRTSIHYALTVSPVISTTFVEQFWTSAKFKTLNNGRYIDAKVAGKPISIQEASIRK
ncbi:putative ribonuclease H-like domain-containing protein, partial [Tanacetum coccineum]